jgi:hypothetical protein
MRYGGRRLKAYTNAQCSIFNAQRSVGSFTVEKFLCMVQSIAITEVSCQFQFSNLAIYQRRSLFCLALSIEILSIENLIERRMNVQLPYSPLQ